MPKLAYILATASVSPFVTMAKSLDGVYSSISMNMAVTGNLKACAFSPDGQYAIAFRQSSVAMNISPRLWELTAIDEWTERTNIFASGSSATATILDCVWLDNTHVIAVGTGGLFIGTLNRVTNQFTWSQTISTNLTYCTAHPDGVHVYVGGNGIANGAMYQRSGDLLSAKSVTGGAGAATVAGKFSPTGDLLVVAYSASPYLGVMSVNAGVTVLTAVSTSTEDRPASGSYSGLSFSKDGVHLLANLTVAPRVAHYRRMGNRMVLGNVGGYSVTSINDIAGLADGSGYAIATGSNASPAGRFRKAGSNLLTEVLTDETGLHNVAGATAYQGITCSPEFTVGADAQVYDSFIEASVGGSLNLTSLKLCLVNSSAVFDRSHTTLAQAVGANEVSGGGWAAGGVALTGEGYLRGAQELYSLIGNFPAVDYTGTGMTFRSAILYDDVNADKRPLAFYNFGIDQVVEQFDRMQFGSAASRLIDYRKA